MKRSSLVGGLLAALAVIFVLARWTLEREREPSWPDAPPVSGSHAGLIHARVTTVDGRAYRGRLRWGGSEEALWSHRFNGKRKENRWAEHVPAEDLVERDGIELLGFRFGERTIELDRPFVARFGDIRRIDVEAFDLTVTLRSGHVVELDRLSADDVADGLRLWDDEHGVVDLGELQLRTIEFGRGAGQSSELQPLYGLVHSTEGRFDGLVQWNRRACLASDELEAGGVRFDAIRAIDRDRVTLSDGSEVALPESQRRGVHVDVRRFGRVTIPWHAFERIEFRAPLDVPTYSEFEAGESLHGRVRTLSGAEHRGRLVFDLDESESTDTLDAPLDGLDISIPFANIASILTPSTVVLRSGERLEFRQGGDLAESNGGMLIFVAGEDRPRYVRWSEVERILFDGASHDDE